MVIDAKLKWPKIYVAKKPPDATSAIYYFTEIISWQGMPEILVSGNASIFESKEFIDFCHRSGIWHEL